MARPRSKSSKATRSDDFKNLSSDVLRLRLQNLNLPVTGSRARMLERLRLATNSASAAIQRRPRGHPHNGRVHKNKPSASYSRVRSLMSLQNRPTRRPTVSTKTGGRTSTQPSSNCSWTLSDKSSRMLCFRPLRCRPSRRRVDLR